MLSFEKVSTHVHIFVLKIKNKYCDHSAGKGKWVNNNMSTHKVHKINYTFAVYAFGFNNEYLLMIVDIIDIMPRHTYNQIKM